MDPRQIVTDVAFRVDPELLGADLASPWRRGAALLVDLTIAGLVSSLGGPGVLGGLAAIFAYRWVSGRGKRRFAFLRSAGGSFAALLVFAVVYAALDEDGGGNGRGEQGYARYGRGRAGDDPGLARASALSGGQIRISTEGATVSSTVGTSGRKVGIAVKELMNAFDIVDDEAERAAVAGAVEEIVATVESSMSDESLTKRIAELKAENETLKKDLESPSFLRSVQAISEDLGLTFGWVGVYFTLFIAWWNGITPGKRMFRIRVYRLDGEPFTLWLAFERFAGYAAGLATGLLGFLQIFWDANRQGIHDRITGTVVIRMAQPGVPRRAWLQKKRAHPEASSGEASPDDPGIGMD